MLKKSIAYMDYNGKPQTMEAYFNLTEPEVVRLDVEFPGGLAVHVKSIDVDSRPQDILHLFERILLSSFGKKSADGKYFLKDPKEAEMFTQSPAYSVLFIELLQDAEYSGKFFNSILTPTG